MMWAWNLEIHEFESNTLQYFRGNWNAKRQVEPLKLSNITHVGLLQAHSKAAVHHLGEGPQCVDEGQAIKESIIRKKSQLQLKKVNLLQKLSALISL